MPGIQSVPLVIASGATPRAADVGDARTVRGVQAMALSVTGVGKRYDSGFTLDDVTFDLPKGYIMGLVGPNGAGKSTLIKLILNMVRRDRGEIRILGHDNLADEEWAKERFGVVFDSSYFVEYWRVAKVGRAMADMYDAWNQVAFDGYVRRFGLDPKKKVSELSRGMRMKLMLAAALSHDARLLILDEPTAGLDVLARDELMDILRDYVSDGERSVLFSTHITGDLERTADLITYITGGRLYYTGPKDEFEDSFRIVKGGPADFDEAVATVAVGVHGYETGFDTLVRAEDVARLTGGAGGRVGADGPGRSGLVVEPASIDDIIRLTNTRAAGGLGFSDGAAASGTDAADVTGAANGKRTER